MYTRGQVNVGQVEAVANKARVGVLAQTTRTTCAQVVTCGAGDDVSTNADIE